MNESSNQKKRNRDLAPDSHSTCSNAANQRKRGLARFSLRRLLYSSPLVVRRVNRAVPGSSRPKTSGNVDGERGGIERFNDDARFFSTVDRSASSFKDVEKGETIRAVQATTSGPDLKRTASKGSLGIAAAPSRVSPGRRSSFVVVHL